MDTNTRRYIEHVQGTESLTYTYDVEPYTDTFYSDDSGRDITRSDGVSFIADTSWVEDRVSSGVWQEINDAA